MVDSSLGKLTTVFETFPPISKYVAALFLLFVHFVKSCSCMFHWAAFIHYSNKTELREITMHLV